MVAVGLRADAVGLATIARTAFEPLAGSAAIATALEPRESVSGTNMLVIGSGSPRSVSDHEQVGVCSTACATLVTLELYRPNTHKTNLFPL